MTYFGVGKLREVASESVVGCLILSCLLVLAISVIAVLFFVLGARN